MVNERDRKTLAPMPPQSRDNRLTVRLTDAERDDWNAFARSEGEETSRAFRRCADIGKKLRQAQKLAQAAGA